MDEHATTATPQQSGDRRHCTRWVVGADGSECSRQAARWAAAQVDGRADELELTTSWSIPVATAMSSMSPLTTGPLLDGIEQSGLAAIDDLARSIEPSIEIPVIRTIGHGVAPAVLIDACAAPNS